MSKKKKALAVAAGVGALLIASVALAGKPKKSEERADTLPEPEEPEEELEEDDVIVTVPTDSGNDVDVVIPTAPTPPPATKTDGTMSIDPEEGGSSKMPNESTSEPLDDGGELVIEELDRRVEEKAAKTGKPISEVAKDVAVELVGDVKPDPLTEVETRPENDPAGTIALARRLLAREEALGWKSDLQDSVAAWQERVGLKSDGLFGIDSAARMAEEVGILPLIRYWSKGLRTKKEAEAAYDKKISAVIADLAAKHGDVSKPHRDALTASMNREKAQTFGTDNPPVQDSVEFGAEVINALGSVAESEGKKEAIKESRLQA